MQHRSYPASTGRLFCLSAGITLLCCPYAWGGKPTKGDGGGSTGGGSVEIVRVEEDWELVISEPNPNVAAPQISCLISPYGNADSTYATFELNHKCLDSDEAGGMQIQIWQYDEAGGASTNLDAPKFTIVGETVRWTQSMKTVDGALKIEVIGGDSVTWGDFGKDATITDTTFGTGWGDTGGTTTTTTTDTATMTTLDSYALTKYVDQSLDKHLQASAGGVSIPNLNAYDPQVSAQHSGVNFAKNLVTSLKIKQVRRFTADGQILVDNTERVVYPR